MTEMLTKAEPMPVSSNDADMRQYLSEIRGYPQLDSQQEYALAKRCADGDEEAIRHMVNANLRLVVSVAREYVGWGVPLLDLIQEGSIGLLAAARKFDYTLEFRFSTYATKAIRQWITRYLQNQSNIIRVPAYTAERIHKIAQVRAQLWQKCGTMPSETELAAACELSVEKLRQLMNLYPKVFSLDAPLHEENDGEIGRILEDACAPQPYEELVREELNQTVNALLYMLNDRQRQILMLHFGMQDGVCHSLEEIGRILGISKERVRQIERQGIEKLQELGASMGLEDYLE